MRHDTATLLILLAAVALLGWFAPDVVLIVFAGCLLAVALRAAGVPLARYFGMAPHWGVMIVAFVALLVIGLLAWLGFNTIANQAREFVQAAPRVLQSVASLLEGLPGGDWLKQHASPEAMTPNAQAAANVALQGAWGTLGALGNIVLVLLLGLYIGADPTLYRSGALALLSPGMRPRAEATLNAMANSLRGWLLGQMFAMVVSGVLTFIGLWALGVPLAGFLSILTAIFGFMPYIGPVIGCVPAMLIAASADPSLVPWVIALFLAVQNIEGNFLTPMVQKQSSDVPPAVLLGAQALFGTGLGFLGVLLAAPIAAAAMAAIRVSYVEGWVEDPADADEKRLIRP
ncbi:Predicted PurR-regulated permease PerM [Roseomonas rosea]|uniref:Predicted PurR-regulated permease PerM n=1 Tax=Muricoccus roseus TaxID=198092 RepID=A0A1M6K052_9PROT|nr:AI-2E family transporter [Roseomonas rosea]SHJ52351.1 Predicted PurR-regulated permease PerM [Roseomonas rosea]